MNLCSRVETVAVSPTVSHSQTCGLFGQAETVSPMIGEFVAVKSNVCLFFGRADMISESWPSKPP